MSKTCSLSEAIQSFVHDGDLVYAAGFTHLIPFAAGHEIIRQGRRDLILARATPDLIYDQVVAAGCACKIIFSYMGNPGVGSLRIMRREIEAGRLEWEEYSHFGMISRLQAGASGLPFMPMNQTAAVDLERANPQYRRVTDPYSGREVLVVRRSTPMSLSCTSSVVIPAAMRKFGVSSASRKKPRLLPAGSSSQRKRLSMKPSFALIRTAP
jgi:glutaconate CoA-transferase, subunit A